MTKAESAAEPPENPAPVERHDVPQVTAEMSGWSRGLASLVSLGSLAVGGLAVFTTDNQAGTVALIAGGVFGGVIALGGRLPTSIKFGDNEIKLAHARLLNAATEQVQKASPEEAGEIIASVTSSPASPLTPEETDARRQAIIRRLARIETVNENYERLVYSVVTGWAWSKGGVDVQIDDRGFDITLTGTKRVALEAKVKTPQTSLTMLDVKQFSGMALAAQDQFDHFILISNVELDTPSRDFWEKSSILQQSKVHFVVAEQLADVVNKLIPIIRDIEDA